MAHALNVNFASGPVMGSVALADRPNSAPTMRMYVCATAAVPVRASEPINRSMHDGKVDVLHPDHAPPPSKTDTHFT
eukprot:5905350-Prymnesium_polylepis.1